MLGITVYLDGESVEITGIISPEDSTIVYTSSQLPSHGFLRKAVCDNPLLGNHKHFPGKKTIRYFG